MLCSIRSSLCSSRPSLRLLLPLLGKVFLGILLLLLLCLLGTEEVHINIHQIALNQKFAAYFYLCMYKAVLKGSNSLERNVNCTYDPDDIKYTVWDATRDVHGGGLRVMRGTVGRANGKNLEGGDFQVVVSANKAAAIMCLFGSCYLSLNCFRIFHKNYTKSKKNEKTLRAQLKKPFNTIAAFFLLCAFPSMVHSIA